MTSEPQEVARSQEFKEKSRRQHANFVSLPGSRAAAVKQNSGFFVGFSRSTLTAE
jgi:hypothetical protein